MASTFRFTQNGYTILITVGTGSGSGVVLEYGKYDLADPDYIVALRQALKAFPVAEAAESIENTADAYARRSSDGELRSSLYGFPDGYLAEILTQSLLLIDQPFVTVQPYITRFLAAVKQEVERRERKASETSRKPTLARQAPGFVYLIKSPTGYYKIGRTKNPDKRIKSFEVKLPFEIELEALIACNDMFMLESELHLRFADKRAQGEWFALSPEEVDYIKGLTK